MGNRIAKHIYASNTFTEWERSATDYSPFGVGLYGRSWSEGYRFGFNGMERDDEIKGSGNSYDFGARMYDARVGRWLSTDAHERMYSGISPYNFSFNSPLVFNDPSGNDGRLTIVDEGNKHTVTLETTVYLIGKDAHLYADKAQFTSKIVKVADLEITGKVWEVQIKVTYKYDEGMNEHFKIGGMEDGAHLDLAGFSAAYKKEELQQFGFQDGDNVMQIDKITNCEGG